MSVASSRTIHELLVRQAAAFGAAPAIIAPHRRPLGYTALRAEVERTAAALAAAGVERRSRVAVALPNGPEAATLIVSVLCTGVCVPLNPALGHSPAKPPPEVLARLRSDLTELRRLPEFQRQLLQLGYEPIDDTPEQFSAEIVKDIERFAAIVKAAKLGAPP